MELVEELELLTEEVELEEGKLLDALEQPTTSRDNSMLEINIVFFFIKTP